ncbi:MAG: sulfatase-like hydrolase/transferase, partial [Candidatus Nanohaloarchaea archaeon]
FEELREGEEEGRWNTTLEKYAYFARESLKRKEWKNFPRALYYFYAQKISSEWGDDGAEKTFEIVKQETGDAEEPFFLFINYVEPHSLYLPPKKYARKFLDTDLDEAYDYASVSPTEFIGTEDEEKADVLERLYDAELNYLDTKLERLFDHINASTDRENIFIFVGDHGELFGKNGLWEHHGSLDEEVLKVPMIVHGNCREGIEGMVELKEIYNYTLSIQRGNDYSFEKEAAFAEYDGFSCHMWKEAPETAIDRSATAVITKDSQLLDIGGDRRVLKGKAGEKIHKGLTEFLEKSTLEIDF